MAEQQTKDQATKPWPSIDKAFDDIGRSISSEDPDISAAPAVQSMRKAAMDIQKQYPDSTKLTRDLFVREMYKRTHTDFDWPGIKGFKLGPEGTFQPEKGGGGEAPIDVGVLSEPLPKMLFGFPSAKEWFEESLKDPAHAKAVEGLPGIIRGPVKALQGLAGEGASIIDAGTSALGLLTAGSGTVASEAGVLGRNAPKIAKGIRGGSRVLGSIFTFNTASQAKDHFENYLSSKDPEELGHIAGEIPQILTGISIGMGRPPGSRGPRGPSTAAEAAPAEPAAATPPGARTAPTVEGQRALPAARTTQPIDYYSRSSGTPLDRVEALADMSESQLRQRQDYLNRAIKSETSRIPDAPQKAPSAVAQGKEALEPERQPTTQVGTRAGSPGSPTAFGGRRQAQNELKAIDLLLHDRTIQAGGAAPPGSEVRSTYGAAEPYRPGPPSQPQPSISGPSPRQSIGEGSGIVDPQLAIQQAREIPVEKLNSNIAAMRKAASDYFAKNFEEAKSDPAKQKQLLQFAEQAKQHINQFQSILDERTGKPGESKPPSAPEKPAPAAPKAAARPSAAPPPGASSAASELERLRAENSALKAGQTKPEPAKPETAKKAPRKAAAKKEAAPRAEPAAAPPGAAPTAAPEVPEARASGEVDRLMKAVKEGGFDQYPLKIQIPGQKPLKFDLSSYEPGEQADAIKDLQELFASHSGQVKVSVDEPGFKQHWFVNLGGGAPPGAK